MTFYGSKEIAASFRTVRKNTIIIAEEIPEDKYPLSATPDTRTIAQTLAHIAIVTKMPLLLHKELRLSNLAGFDFMAAFGPIMAEEQKQRSKAELIELLTVEGEKFASWVEGVSEEFLAEIVTYPEGMMPPTKTRFEMLIAPKEHEMHHRGQLMVLQRMAGGKPHLTRRIEAMMEQMQAAQAGNAA